MMTSKGMNGRIAMAVAMAFAAILAVPAGTLYAKVRDRGEEIIVQKKDGTFLTGELLAVEGRTLVLLDASSGKDIRVAVDDVDAFRVLKRSRVLPAMLKGFLTVGAAFPTVSLVFGGSVKGGLMVGAVAGGLFAVFKGLRAAARGQDETAVLRGAPAPRTEFALKRLGKMAFFGSSLPADIAALRKSRGSTPPPVPKGREAQDLTSLRFPRFHISFEPFGILSEGKDPYTSLFRKMEFADTRPGGSFLFIKWGPTPYPVGHGAGGITLLGGRAEYSVSRSFSAGFAYGTMGSGSTKGFRMIPVTWRGGNYYSEAYVTENRSSDGYFLTAAWMPVPDTFFKRTSFKLGVELGLCVSRHHFGASELIDEVDGRSLSKTVPAAGVFGEVDLYSGRNMSVGVRAGYRFARTRVEAFALKGTYMMFEESGSDEFTLIHVPLDIAFPAHTVELGGPTAGVSLGFHF